VISQRGSNLTFTNEQGVTAQGKFLGNKNLNANGNGHPSTAPLSTTEARLTGATEPSKAASASTGSLAPQTGIY